jgi:aldose 1-epimerase
MPKSLSLQCGALRCEMLPAMGGCVAGLWFGGQPVLSSTPAAQLQSARVAASYPLVPYSNRVGYGQLHWEGRTYALPLNFAPEPHSIHGIGWERAWAVESSSASQAVLFLQHTGDSTWPFAFECRQIFRLTTEALELHLSLTNRADVAAPAGLGWHPYFAKSAQTHIRFTAAARWEMDANLLPTHRLDHAGLDTGCTSLDIDHCFEGWSGALLLEENGLRIQVTSDLDRLVVFTTPGRDSIAIEPVSHVNNALALSGQTGTLAQQLGIRVLQPGETFSASMRIAVEAQA